MMSDKLSAFKLMMILCLLLFALESVAENNWDAGSVSGVISDSNGPVVNSKVAITSSVVPSPLYGEYGFTNENGYFEFSNVPVGGIQVKVFNSAGEIVSENASAITSIDENVNMELTIN